MIAMAKNDNFTDLGLNTKTQLEEQLKEILALLLTREEVNNLIDEFVKETASDAKGDIEKKIIEKLVVGNKFTQYFDEYKNKPICDYDKGNNSDVKKAAEKYRAYAEKIPSSADTKLNRKDGYEQKVIEVLSSIFESCRASSDYITRLVNRRIDALNPEIKNENDSTRLLIFKQALKALGFPKGAYLSKELIKYIYEITGLSKKASEEEIAKAIIMLTDNSDESVTNVFNKMKEIEDVISVAKKDYDELLDKYKILSDKYKSVKKEYETTEAFLLKQQKVFDKDKKKAESELQKAKKNFNKVSQSIDRDEENLKKDMKAEEREKIEYRMTENKKECDKLKNLIEERTKTVEETETKLAQIENEFNDSNSNYCQLKALYKKLESEKNDLSTIKERKKNVHKDKKKEYDKNWAPLQWADDIANGFFNDQQTTRKKLYWFAIIFEMTFYSGAINEREIPDTDIQKNLFYDFYADNLLNNLMIDDTNELKKIEKEPSGQGINFKNYAEAIYLYYLHKPNMKPLEKICAAEKMILNCTTNDTIVIDSQIQRHADKNTVLYEPIMYELLSLNTPEALYNFITQNYVCGRKSTTPMRVASSNKTASKVYKDLITGLKKAATEIDQQIDLSENLAFIDGSVECKTPSAKQLKSLSMLCEETIECLRDEPLKKLLQKINDKFHFVWKKKSIDECIDSTFTPKNDVEEDVSRTRLIVLYYFLVGLEYLNEGVVFNDFQKFYDEFCDEKTIRIISSRSDVKDSVYEGLNSCLAAAGYQEINPKNIFDISVLFFAFKKYMELSNDNN